MKKIYILIYILILLSIPSVCFAIKNIQVKSLPSESKMDVLHENGVEYWCDKDFCYRADPKV